ncbi:3-dehydroquinate synthase [Heyndrickxia acidicola]|uniref:3-dehydroquinate synthase n=1 Tax=Heyndrickxia acidicola TaxID=209389 RepID=A0ABU6MJY6_9BACI|nr:3-dehydroquinate synthase [Heyndrickxia acidicola]MED1204998.1 3-dehydroquinate synthase [Heyndrickxia acidicola]
MQIIDIKVPGKKYPAFVGENALQELRAILSERTYSKIMIVTDETVGKLHLQTLLNSLPESTSPVVYSAPSGEKAKTFSVYEKCLSFAIEAGLDRKACILALGGGAVGDLSGFVAATFMRGIHYIQIPTTILAHDSAVGGKVAINHPLGKNLVGVFHHPEAVIYYTPFLSTLPPRQIRSGFAEVVKEALIADPLFLKQLMKEAVDLTSMPNLPFYLKKGMEVKAAVVQEDEKEMGIRAFLNFGHTLGHALEANAGYGVLTHGEAVMTGMIFALSISRKQLGLQFPLDEFIQWIEKLGYEWRIPKEAGFEELLQWMKRDKKAIAQKPMFVLLKEIGKPVMEEADEKLLRECFYQLM